MGIRKKVKKKKVQDADEFLTTSGKLFLYVSNNWKSILSWSIGLLLIILISIGFVYNKKRKYAKAFEELYKATVLLESENQEDNNDVKEKVSEIYEEIIRKYPRTKAAGYANLYLGHIYYEKGLYDKAIEAYNEVKDKWGGILREDAWEGIGYSYERLGKYKEAIDIYNKIIEGEGSMPKGQYYISLGRCYEEIKDKEGASKAYTEFIEKYPDSKEAEMIKDKIKELKEG